MGRQLENGAAAGSPVVHAPLAATVDSGAIEVPFAVKHHAAVPNSAIAIGTTLLVALEGKDPVKDPATIRLECQLKNGAAADVVGEMAEVRQAHPGTAPGAHPVEIACRIEIQVRRDSKAVDKKERMQNRLGPGTVGIVGQFENDAAASATTVWIGKISP